MVSSKENCMTESERIIVKATLKAAFKEGRQFVTIDALENYLEKHLAETLIRSHIRGIFGCYLEQNAARNKKSLSKPLSPGLSDGSQLNPSQTPPNTDDGEEQTDAEMPSFIGDNDAGFNINVHCAYLNNLDIAWVRVCEGNVSYVSEEFARRNLLTIYASTTVLAWRAVGQKKWEYTRCRLIPQDQLPSQCQVALAEDRCSADTESMGDREDNKLPGAEPSENKILLGISGGGILSGNLQGSRQSPEATPPYDLSPEDELEQITASLIVKSAIAIWLRKRKAPHTSALDVDSYGSSGGSQQKRSRKH